MVCARLKIITASKARLFLGYVVDILLSAVLGADLDVATKTAVLKAFNKVVWIQNDRKSQLTIICRTNSSYGPSVLSTLHKLIIDRDTYLSAPLDIKNAETI